MIAELLGGLRGAPLSALSFYYSNDDGNLGLTDLAFPRGFDQMTTALGRGVDVRLNHVVQSITHGGTSVEIGTNRGIFRASHVIVTLPLGILQRPDLVRFQPLLPTAKLLAIRRLKMGIANKIFLQFKNKWWEGDETLILRVGNDPDRAGLVNAVNWVGTPIIGVLTGGRYAIESEGYSDERLVNDFMEILRRSFKGRVPDPEPGVLRSRWHSDPFCFGAYSHIPVGATSRDYVTLSEPVGKVLFFAGEATMPEFPGSARGAYLSGRREAKRILALRGIGSGA
jgi:monoamine oxidase